MPRQRPKTHNPEAGQCVRIIAPAAIARRPENSSIQPPPCQRTAARVTRNSPETIQITPSAKVNVSDAATGLDSKTAPAGNIESTKNAIEYEPLPPTGAKGVDDLEDATDDNRPGNENRADHRGKHDVAQDEGSGD